MSLEERKEPGGNHAPVDIWVGTTLGILKGISLAKGEVLNYYSANCNLEDTDKSLSVCAMCWEHECRDGVLYCGLRNGVVQQFSAKELLFQSECDCTGGPEEGMLVGLGKHEDVLISCTDRGDLSFWPTTSEKTLIGVGNAVSCMAASPSTMLQVATGGKENNLKLWDGHRPDAPVFQAKNVKNDKLDLRVPEWVTAIGYTVESGDQPTLAVATGHHQVRLYDTRAQRRPVYSHEYGEHPFYALTVAEDGRSFVVGNSIGDISRCDVRTGKVVSRYSGGRGGVKDLVTYSDGDQTLLASVSLDRFLRVYTLEAPRLLHKMYLKLQPTCMLFNNSGKVPVEEPGCKGEVGPRAKEEAVGSEEDEEDIWEKMEVVGGKTIKRRSKSKVQMKVMKKQKLKKRDVDVK